MPPSPRVSLSAETFGLMARIVHRSGQEAAAILRAEGLNPAQFQLLLAVGRAPGEPQRRFGQQAGVTPGNVSMLVTKLEQAGLVRRSADGAANRLWLTDAGERLVERLSPDQDQFLVDRFAVLDEDELTALNRLLARTAEGLRASEG